MATVYPPREIFARPVLDSHEVIDRSLGGYSESNYLKTYHPVEGGSYIVYADKPFHYKGHPFPEAVQVNNEVKRLTLAYVLSFLPKRKWLENFLLNYTRLAESLYDVGVRNPVLKTQYYNKLPKELWRLAYWFMLSYGIADDIAWRLGRILATMVHYDDAYYIRIADIFTAMDYTNLYNNPRQEVLRGLAIYKTREKAVGYASAGDRFTTLFKLASCLLYLPKVKKAFRQALLQVNYQNLQLDEADCFYGCNRLEYDICGVPWEVRKAKYENLCNEHIDKLMKNIMSEETTPVVEETPAAVEAAPAAPAESEAQPA